MSSGAVWAVRPVHSGQVNLQRHHNAMQFNSRPLVSALRGAFCLALLAGLLPPLQAADASGTWSWTMGRRGGGTGEGEQRKITLTLKVEGEHLTGKMSSPGRQGG